MPGSWSHFHHGADIGVRGIGSSKEEAFAAAAVAMTAVLTDPADVRSEEAVEISCEAPDQELLLVDWLNALIYEMAVRKMIFGDFQLSIEGMSLRALASGEKVDWERHSPAVEVKGATYTELRVSRSPGGIWLAQCVVDV